MTTAERTASEPQGLPSWLRALVTICGVQAGIALAYLLGTDAGIAAPATMAIPFVWITAGLFGVWYVDPPRVPTRVKLGAAAVGVSYTILLAWLTGVVSLSSGEATGLNLMTLPPGWGPAIGYDGPFVAAQLFPYRVLGYAALGYLVAVAVADASGAGDRACSAAGGVVALSSCASCSLPLVSWVVGGLGSATLVGSSAGLGGASASLVSSTAGLVGPTTYLLATTAYVLSVAALVWRERVAVAISGRFASVL